MVLVHTEEELLATEEPAMCVIGATSYDCLDALSNEPVKVYVRIVRANNAFIDEENRLFDEMMAEPATRGEATEACEQLGRDIMMFVFGDVDDVDIIGRNKNGLLVLQKTVDRKGVSD